MVAHGQLIVKHGINGLLMINCALLHGKYRIIMIIAIVEHDQLKGSQSAATSDPGPPILRVVTGRWLGRGDGSQGKGPGRVANDVLACRSTSDISLNMIAYKPSSSMIITNYNQLYNHLHSSIINYIIIYNQAQSPV